MQRENELLSLFFRLHQDAAARERIKRLLAATVEWGPLLDEIEREGIASFVFRQLDRFALNTHFPPQIAERLKSSYYSIYRQNMALLEEAKELLSGFAEEGIQAMVLKGIFLAETIYGDIGVRPVGDIDILIKRRDIAKAHRILNVLEYQAPAYYEDALKTKTTSLNSLVYRKEGRLRGTVAHLHWHIINSSWPLEGLADTIAMERVWSRAEPANVGGVGALTLSPEHCVMYLAHHGFHHSFNRVFLAIDIQEALRYYHDRFDWDLAVQEARKFGLSAIFYFSLHFCAQALQSEIPQLQRIKPCALGFLEKIISFCVRRKMMGAFLSYCAYLARERGLRARLRFIIRTFFPSRYGMAHNYECAPSQVTFGLYYKRLAGKV